MNVQEVMSPTSIFGNAAIASVDSVLSGIKVVDFFKSRLPLQTWLLMLYLWAREYPVSDAEKRLKFLQGWQSIYTSGCMKFVQPNYYRHRLSWVVQVWSRYGRSV